MPILRIVVLGAILLALAGCGAAPQNSPPPSKEENPLKGGGY